VSRREALLKAREIVEASWGQGMRFPYTKKCLVSALLIGSGYDHATCDSLMREMEKVVRVTHLAAWNDAKGRKREEVLAAIDQTLEVTP
jgi:hypothetical protein